MTELLNYSIFLCNSALVLKGKKYLQAYLHYNSVIVFLFKMFTDCLQKLNTNWEGLFNFD